MFPNLLSWADDRAQFIAKPADLARRVIIILGCLHVLVTMLFKVSFDLENLLFSMHNIKEQITSLY